jgi:hypothetical protein
MLAFNKEGKLCLEDADGVVELDFSTLVSLLEVIQLVDKALFRMSRETAYLRRAALPLSKESIRKKPPLKSWLLGSRHASLEALQGRFLEM